jgi:antitoxin FitA
MASLSIPKLDDDVYELLQQRAARHGVSMEEEIRQILKRAVSAPERLGDVFLKIFGPSQGVELALSSNEPHEPLDVRDFVECGVEVINPFDAAT